MSRYPEVKWAEREDKIYLTVLLADAKDPKVNVDPDGTFTFSAAAGTDNNLYELKLELLDKINVEECKINIGVRTIVCVLEKAEKKWWTKLLRGNAKTPHYVKVDWDKWVDEDDDAGAPSDLDLGGMDFSKFGDMGGMGGMPGMGGMGGMGGMPGMGGMGGMGGMPGMGGMGGMGGMDMSALAGMGGMGGMGGMDMSALAGMGGMGGFGDDAMGDDFEDSDDEGEVKKPEGEAVHKTEGEASKDKAEPLPSS